MAADDVSSRKGIPVRNSPEPAPPSELISMASYLSEAVSRVARARDRVVLKNSSAWEAPREAWALSNLMVKNVRAVLLMARHDEALVTAAWTSARAAFEQAIRIIWLLYPGDRFESECRWLALLRETEQYHHKVEAECRETDPDKAELHRARENSIKEFRTSVTARLPVGYTVPPKTPSISAMMHETNSEKMYQFYREGSQYVHGTWHGTSAHRKDLGSMASWGDFTSSVDWILPFRLCWLSLKESMRFVFDRHGEDLDEDPRWSAFFQEVDQRFQDFALALVERTSSAEAAASPNGEVSAGRRSCGR
ncbi:DUF5677 domain-containing protein [Nonomuraea sp. NPDC049714]|uniref:DUF5677 domain-containing protein n=1 Tax=Nonomuraea sp. NPDC049714 TaxID=3364357 RepID=UPI0037AE3AB5